jgi:hypothetical protein
MGNVEDIQSNSNHGLSSNMEGKLHPFAGCSKEGWELNESLNVVEMAERSLQSSHVMSLTSGWTAS